MGGRALYLLGSLLAPALPAGADTPMLDTRQHNWALSLFTPEGFRSMTLSGDEAHPVNRDQIDVVNLEIIAFSEDPSARVKSIVLSPAASFFAQEQRASGPADVRIIQDAGEITGQDWTFERAGEKVTIRRNVRIVFKAQLTSLLK
jgi:hypothetical protein